MKKQTWIVLLIVFAAALFFTNKFFQKKVSLVGNPSATQNEEIAYWTCPMHPQIHSGKAGECPICHMKLVNVKTFGSPAFKEQENESRAMVATSPEQMKLLGVQKVQVEKMDLTAHIPPMFFAQALLSVSWSCPGIPEK